MKSSAFSRYVSITNLHVPVAERARNGAKWWRRSMGDDFKRVRFVYPRENVEPVRLPILLIHGDQDSVVPVRSSRAYNELRAGKGVRYVELKGDDHWLSSAPTRTLMLGEIETYLGGNLGRKTTTAAK
jgi:pimeloyl-ACP methyl ester carboxylesterase